MCALRRKPHDLRSIVMQFSHLRFSKTPVSQTNSTCIMLRSYRHQLTAKTTQQPNYSNWFGANTGHNNCINKCKQQCIYVIMCIVQADAWTVDWTLIYRDSGYRLREDNSSGQSVINEESLFPE